MEWFFRKWSWANENRLFWANFVLLVVVAAILFILPAPDASDFRVRALGMVLQSIGVLTVWLDLTATARNFGTRR